MIDEEQLQAYVDGELSAEMRTSVEAFLAANPSEAERVRGYQTQRIALQALAAPVTSEPLPESLDKLRQEMVAALASARKRRLAWRWIGAAAVLAGVAVLGWSVLLATDVRQTDLAKLFTQQATRAHTVYGAQPFGTPANENADVFRWFARRVIQSPASAPDLRPQGFRLVGSQVIPTPDRPNIQLVYANEQKLNVTLMMSASQESEPSDFKSSQEGETTAWYWSRNGLQFALVGQLPRDRLLEVARAINWQMSDPQEGRRDKSEAATTLPASGKGSVIAPVRSASGGESPVTPATHNPANPAARVPPVSR